MKKIQLTRGKVALVDNEDFTALNKHKWCAMHRRGLYYAVRGIPCSDNNRRQRTELMHRVILDAKTGQAVDHANGDGLDNRRANIRFATHSQNIINRRMQCNNTSGYRGVGWQKQERKWRARIQVEGKVIFLGFLNQPKKPPAVTIMRQNAILESF